MLKIKSQEKKYATDTLIMIMAANSCLFLLFSCGWWCDITPQTKMGLTDLNFEQNKSDSEIKISFALFYMQKLEGEKINRGKGETKEVKGDPQSRGGGSGEGGGKVGGVTEE